jgi:CelD/BcsL family acetyltransferase involved in cellulose biosynthesis
MQEAGQPLAFVAQEEERRLLLPIIVRPIPPAMTGEGQALFDATSPRGYPGPVVTPVSDSEVGDFLDRAIEAFIKACRDRNIVTAFIRLHPFLSPPPDAFRRAGPLIEHGQSVSIDLRLSPEELWRQTRNNHRHGIRRAVRLGYTARIDDSWAAFEAFVSVYEQSMVRLGAEPFWRLSRTYLEDLRESLDGRMHLCVAEANGEIAAATLLTEVDGIVEYHLAGTADAHVHASPSKLLVDFVRQWAKARGNRCLHLGGSLHKDDSLILFKLGFSPLQHPVHSWRLVVDAPAYQILADRWQSRQDSPPDPLNGYFPAYRKPGSRPA